MSPHVVLPSPDRSPADERLLELSAVTSNGFLPPRTPLRRLPNPYYSPWEDLIQQLSTLLDEKTFRERLLLIPVLSTKQLRTEEEWRRAYVILCFFCHAYIWGGDKAEETLPPQVSVPLLAVAEHLELPPVATYAALNLWNFESSSMDFTDLDSLTTLHTFTGTTDESWFLCVSVAMEAQGAYILPVMLNALDAIKTRDYRTIIDSLNELSSCIQKVASLLERMHEKCDPMVFYHQIRPFLAGSKNMKAAGLPFGVFYDEGQGRGSWRQLRGGSNGQSSLIQFFDLVLGVSHTSTGNSQPDGDKEGPKNKDGTGMSFHEEVRNYMPGPHRRFLEHVARKGSIRNLALLPPTTPEQQQLQAAYQHATETLARFRDKHLQIVTRYIILPSKQPRLAIASCDNTFGQSRKVNEVTGTGGTALLPFLKQVRDETYEAGHLASQVS